jgi:hypothetical protein
MHVKKRERHDNGHQGRNDTQNLTSICASRLEPLFFGRDRKKKSSQVLCFAV